MRIKRFLQDELGQDLIDYTLLMAFVALGTAALFIGSGGSIKGVWNSADSQLTTANSTTAAATAPSNAGSGGGRGHHGGGGCCGGGGNRHHF
jgi:Flp pilus assembly pilin Flp